MSANLLAILVTCVGGLWLMFGIGCSSMASRIGHPIAGFFVGLFLGPLGFAIVSLALPAASPATQPGGHYQRPPVQ